jgi:ribosomal protein L7/L12
MNKISLEDVVSRILSASTVEILEIISKIQESLKASGVDISKLAVSGASAGAAEESGEPKVVKKKIVLIGLKNESAKMSAITTIKKVYGLSLQDAKKKVDAVSGAAVVPEVLKTGLTDEEVKVQVAELETGGAVVKVEAE